MTQLKFVVVSDIHADERADKPTYVRTEPPAASRNRHPFKDLQECISRENITADYLVSPGDIANQADMGGLVYGWRRLHDIKAQLGAGLIAVPGNHDVVTRQPSADPRAMLKNLLPSFPTGELSVDESFWANGWSLIEGDSHRILLMDSTIGFPKYPAGIDEDSDEYKAYLSELDRGSLTSDIEESLDNALAVLGEHKINVAVIHHHPQEHQLRGYLQDSYGPMRRGADLIHILSSHPKAGRWVIIHGHKHVPQLVNSVSTTSNGPLILCAGSMGAKFWEPVLTFARNQFHVVTVTDDPAPGASSLRGTVESYTWSVGEGWYVTDRKGAGLPARGGFGCADDHRVLSDRIVQIMDDDSLNFMRYADLVSRIPQLPYQLPIDFEYLQADLEGRGFSFERDQRYRLTQLSRTAPL